MDLLKNMTAEKRAATVFFALMVITAFVALTAVYSVREMYDFSDRAFNYDEPALNASLRASRDVQSAQLALVSAFASADSEDRRSYFGDYAASTVSAIVQLEQAAKLVSDATVARHLLSDFEESQQQWSANARVFIDKLERDASMDELRDAWRDVETSFGFLSLVADGIVSAGIEPIVIAERSQLAGRAMRSQLSIGVSLLFGLLCGTLIAMGSIRLIRIQNTDEAIENRYRDFDRRVQRAMQLVEGEPELLNIVRDALDDVVGPEQSAELIMAGSSRSKVRRVASSTIDSRWQGCQVPTPEECPTMRCNSRMVFPSNKTFEACPFFKNRGEGVNCATCVPVSVMGHTVGVLHVVGPEHVVLTSDQARRLDSIALKAGDRIGLARALAAKDKAANTDSLTGLANRRALESALSMIVDEHGCYAVVYCDLDRFKRLNDEHGHEIGDRVLCLFADVLSKTLRPTDFIARWGGEEFVVVLPGADMTAAAHALKRLREKLKERSQESPLPDFTASFGVSDSTMDRTFDDVLHRADEALSLAKQQGRNRVVYDGPEIDEANAVEVALAEPSEGVRGSM